VDAVRRVRCVHCVRCVRDGIYAGGM